MTPSLRCRRRTTATAAIEMVLAAATAVASPVDAAPAAVDLAAKDVLAVAPEAAPDQPAAANNSFEICSAPSSQPAVERSKASLPRLSPTGSLVPGSFV